MDRRVRSLLWDAILSRCHLSVVLSSVDGSHARNGTGQVRFCSAKGICRDDLRPVQAIRCAGVLAGLQVRTPWH